MKLMSISNAFILSYRSKNYGISLWYRETETGRLLGSFGCRGNIFHLPDGSSWAQIGHYACSSETGNGSTPSYTTWYWWNVKMKKRRTNGTGKIIGLPNSGTLYQQSVRKVDASYITKLQSVFRGKIRTSDISSKSFIWCMYMYVLKITFCHTLW